MKFQVREGFVAAVSTKVDIGDGKHEIQTNTYFGGQICDLSAEQAELHAQKLEPKDKAATEFLEKKVLPTAPAASLGLSPEALALVQTLATEMAKQIVAAVQAPAPAASASA